MVHMFITGMARSGTTLLDKLLCNHDDISVLSQPFPFFFIEAKREFYKSIDYSENYFFLNHYFQESKYKIEDLNNFLNNFTFTREQLQRIFDQMANYSGQYTHVKNYHALIDKLEDFSFLSVFKNLQKMMAYRGKAYIFGSKEVHCEEFMPYLVSKGVKCIIIIRDPRAIIASINHGKGKKFTGEKRPILVNIRNWRKSVAFALHLESNRNFLWLKYEDLIRNPYDELEKITSFLDIKKLNMDIFENGIRDQTGKLWKSNSSFSNSQFLSPASLDRYKKVLPIEVKKYIEALCYPEMHVLDYKCDFLSELDRNLLRSFEEPYKIIRKEFDPHYSSSKTNIENEIRRLEILEQSISDKKLLREYLIFPDLYNRLRKRRF